MNVDASSILAFNDPWHDSSFCIFGSDSIIHVEVERFSRRKYEFVNPIHAFCTMYPQFVEAFQFIVVQEGTFLAPALRKILQTGGPLDRGECPSLELADPRVIQELGVPPMVQDDETIQRFLHHMKRPDVKVFYCGHHAAHAANAFYSSDFPNALTITLEGGGFDYLADRIWAENVVENRSFDDAVNKLQQIYGGVYDCTDYHCRPVHQVTDFSFGWAWYRIVTRILRLKEGEEGTVMAMAALGDHHRFHDEVEQDILWQRADYDLSFSGREALETFLLKLAKKVESVSDRFHLAAAFQVETEKRVRQFITQFIPDDCHYLCVAGGTFLNCQIVGKLQKWFPQVKQLFIPPAPYDGGISLGAAQLVCHETLRRTRGIKPGQLTSFAMGPKYSRIEVIAAARANGAFVSAADTSEFLNMVENGKILGLFMGAAESGRRALGHRSIVADPRSIRNRERINKTIKNREWFRPLAPMILSEAVAEWFECEADFQSPYMSSAIPVREEKKALIPAVLHFDGTARLQTVHKKLTPSLHALLSDWHRLSEVPILINTSFNDREPIVETPHDAICTLKRSGLDGIYFADHNLVVTG